jgi:hypothetical protein
MSEKEKSEADVHLVPVEIQAEIDEIKEHVTKLEHRLENLILALIEAGVVAKK